MKGERGERGREKDEGERNMEGWRSRRRRSLTQVKEGDMERK